MIGLDSGTVSLWFFLSNLVLAPVSGPWHWSRKGAASLISVCLNKVLVCSNSVFCGGLFLDFWTLKLTVITFTEDLVQTEVDPVLAVSISGSLCEPCLVDWVGQVLLVSKFYVKCLECLSSLQLENIYNSNFIQHLVWMSRDVHQPFIRSGDETRINLDS